MIILGVDYGRRYLGLAVALPGIGKEPEVLPIPAILNLRTEAAFDSLGKVCWAYRAGVVVFGLPFGKNGEVRKNVLGIKKFAQEFVSYNKLHRGQEMDLKLDFVDERLTSFEANKTLAGISTTRKKKRGLENSLAACLILKNYLDRQQQSQESRGEND